MLLALALAEHLRSRWVSQAPHTPCAASVHCDEFVGGGGVPREGSHRRRRPPERKISAGHEERRGREDAHAGVCGGGGEGRAGLKAQGPGRRRGGLIVLECPLIKVPRAVARGCGTSRGGSRQQRIHLQGKEGGARN